MRILLYFVFESRQQPWQKARTVRISVSLITGSVLFLIFFSRRGFFFHSREYFVHTWKKMQPFLNITFCLLLFHFPGFYSSLNQTAVLSVDKLKSSKRKLFYRNWNEIVPSICGV